MFSSTSPAADALPRWSMSRRRPRHNQRGAVDGDVDVVTTRLPVRGAVGDHPSSRNAGGPAVVGERPVQALIAARRRAVRAA